MQPHQLIVVVELRYSATNYFPAQKRNAGVTYVPCPRQLPIPTFAFGATNKNVLPVQFAYCHGKWVELPQTPRR